MEVQSEEALRLAFPGLDWLTEASPNYQTWRQTYFLDNEAIPRAIVRPQNGKEVSAIIRLANACDIPFTIRSGGHDLYGRSIVSDAICIDMRKINSVEISSDRRSAKIGGGVLIGNLLENLSEHGLVTPFGSVPSVGYVGWSCLGGYGSLSTHWGLGVDQIIDAEIVNAQGDIVSAGEDTLMGIRGACGSFGIVVNMRIKVYELKTVSAKFK
jgi:FAD/FMN-containing dehydrogenase